MIQIDSVDTLLGDSEIAIFENEVPEFVYQEIDRIYEHMGCSLLNLRMLKKLPGASTYVVRQDGAVITALLFRVEGRKVQVLSDFVRLDPAEVQVFADTLFRRFPSAWMVVFDALKTQIGAFPYPFQRQNCSEDIVINLPETVDEYRGRLAKKTRHELKRYAHRLTEDHPSYGCRLCVKEEIREEDIRAILDLQRQRMAGKGLVSRIDEEETQWILHLALQRGMVLVATLDGEICGGWIGFCIGRRCFSHVIAHDPKYNPYALGMLIHYTAICEGISRGLKSFNLMFGRNPYKYQLLGTNVDVAHVDIYRSRFHAFLFSGRIARNWTQGRIRCFKQWVFDAERNGSPAMARTVRALRSLKRAWRGV